MKFGNEAQINNPRNCRTANKYVMRWHDYLKCWHDAAPKGLKFISPEQRPGKKCEDKFALKEQDNRSKQLRERWLT